MTTAQPAVMATPALSPYRYTLHRGWAPGLRCCWIMLNPSTATDTTDDPTLRRCIRFSSGWGFGQLVVVNLFALRATKPAGLANHTDPIDPDNDTAILAVAHHAAQVSCACEAHQWATPRARTVTNLLHGTPLSCLGITQHGHPRHPLYVKAITALTPFRGAAP